MVKSVAKILDLVAQFQCIARERLAKEGGFPVRDVEKNIALVKSEGKMDICGYPIGCMRDVDMRYYHCQRKKGQGNVRVSWNS